MERNGRKLFGITAFTIFRWTNGYKMDKGGPKVHRTRVSCRPDGTRRKGDYFGVSEWLVVWHHAFRLKILRKEFFAKRVGYDKEEKNIW